MQSAVKGFRLSIQQSRIWSTQREHASYYRSFCQIRVEGLLNAMNFHQALMRLVARHTLLRTHFVCLPGMDIPVQVIAEQSTVFAPLIHLEKLELEQQMLQVAEYEKHVLAWPFDLEHGPLFLCMLLRLSEHNHVLITCLPALCADASTLKQLMIELVKEYSDCLTGEVAEIDDESILQYVDVAAWQETVLEEEDAEEQRRYWQRIDLKMLSAQKAPFEYKNSRNTTDEQSAVLPAQSISVLNLLPTFTQIQAMLESTGTSMEAFLLACWSIAIWRLTSQTSFILGIECDGRYFEELASVVGPYSRLIPLALSFSEHMTTERLTKQLAALLEEAKKRQIYFTWPVPSLHKHDDEENTFPLHFAYEEWPERLSAHDVRFMPQQCSSWMEPFKLKLHAVCTGRDLQLKIHFDPACISSDLMQQLSECIATLMQEACARPKAPIYALPLLTSQAQDQMRVAFTNPMQSLSCQTLIAAFESQVELNSERVVAVCDDIYLTYNELNRRANCLAHALRRMGVGADVAVGLYCSRSMHMLIGMLAILKAGGAYVPLDPDLPTARLIYQLQDIGAQLVLTQEHLSASLLTWEGQVLCLDDTSGWESEVEQNPTWQGHPDDLAYIIYTSGSTGLPKGVMIRQHSVIAYTTALCQVLAPWSGLQFATVSTLAADLGNTAIFCALASGGCLHILSYETVTSGAAFAYYISCHPIDVLKITPSHISALLASCDGAPILPRRHLVLGGEVLTFSLLRQLEAQDTTCRVLNHYGPTETTIGALVNTSTKEKKGALTVPIGRPIVGAEAYILDAFGHIVPMGITGELYLGGPGLARGYWRQPEMTHERFVPYPWDTAHSEARLYRTGDLARYHSDGSIEFMGRADAQVKIRGYRIEPGEIEAVLGKHPKIREALVILREDTPGERRLVAYLRSQQPEPDREELRLLLAEYLPGYMVPAVFIFLRAFPLNTNGKVNREQLPVPDIYEVQLEASYVAPRTASEEMLVNIWQAILGVKRIGIYDNFVSLGGHSLLATQIIARIRQILQVDVPLRILFEAPTIASLHQCIEDIQRTEKKTLFPPLIPASRDKSAPLSFAQRRLWFLDRLDPGATAYNIQHAQRLQGKLNRQALERSLTEIIQRHEILHTTFQMMADQPMQIVQDIANFNLPVIDISGLLPDEHEQQVRRLTEEEEHQSFNLAQGPLLRVVLLQLTDTEYVFVLTMHHIISDGWSNTLFFQELVTLYQAFADGHASPLSTLALQYADFAIWQQQWLQGEFLNEQLSYWKQQLQDVPHLALPTDYIRPALQSFRGAELSTYLPEQLQQELTMLSQREGVTLFMLLLAAFQVLLLRYSGQEDISIGTPIANRTHEELEKLIGFFVNTLVVRTDLSGNPSFKTLLVRVREVMLGAYAHQDMPFEYLVEELQPERDMSRSPLFQILFTFQNIPRSDEKPVDLIAQSLRGNGGTSKFDLTLSVTETLQGLHATVEYNTDLFEANTINRLLGHWQRLLEGIVSDPDQLIADLPLLVDAEKSYVPQQWNTQQTPFPVELCLHECFEAQVARTPDAVAVLDGEVHLSYAALDLEATRLALFLQSCGVGPETRVGLCLSRSAQLLVAIIGILKSGGAYVPLDPDYPSERRAFLQENAHLSLIVLEESLRARIGETSIQVVSLEQVRQQDRLWQGRSLQRQVSAQNLAYVIYTSGSTGSPKGVMVQHDQVVRLFSATESALALTSHDTWTLFHSYAFDFSVWEIWGALLHGGKLVVVPYWTSRSSEAVYQLVCREQITVFSQTPTAFRQFQAVDELSREHNRQFLRLVIFGGEALDLTSLKSWFAWHGDENPCLVNMYGITETTVHVTLRILKREDAFDGKGSLIGRPLADLQAYLLDRRQQPLPLMVPGELYVGGAGVARGYLYAADKTAECFLPDPWSMLPGGRMYKTGDQVRCREEGELEYVGRRDYQVKIRGYRIELGEIETVLRQQGSIREGVVVVREDIPGNKQLVGYVVLSDEAKENERFVLDQLRYALGVRLPEYMVPASWVALDTLPVTPSGKVDRKKLPAPSSGETHIWVEARGPLEEMMSGIWCDVLNKELVGINENFFELGGHSLLATQIVARLETLFQIELPLKSVFEAPTIALLAAKIDEQLQAVKRSHVPALVPIARVQALSLSFAQQRLWFLDQLEPGSTIYLLPMVRQLRGPLQLWALEHSFLGLLQRHEVLRTTFAWREHNPVQVIQEVEHYRIPVVDLRGIEQSKRERVAESLVREERQKPFDLSQGPLLRVLLLRIEAEEHLLLVTLHHIVSDGWSNRLLWQEVIERYQRALEEQPVQLPPLPVQYADYAHWQREWLQGEVLEEQLGYWREQLRGGTVLELPTDFPRPAIQTFRGAHQSLILSEALAKDLLALSRKQNVTLFMLLLAAFYVLLQRYSGQNDISVGTPVANRTRSELEGLIGLFLNTLVLRCDLSNNPSFEELVRQVRVQALGAYTHQDVPFEQLVEMLQPERDLSRSPLFQAMFSLQQQEEVGEIPGELEISDFPSSDSLKTKFDLSCSVLVHGQHIFCEIEYNTDLFEPRTIQQLLVHWEEILKGIVIQPGMTIAQLPLLTPEEEALQLSVWNETDVPFDHQACIPTLFEAQVRRVPHAVALCYQDQQLTYTQLHILVDQLAKRLRDMRLGLEAHIGISLPRSPMLVVGLLAILKLGGAYVPLDPTYPTQRVRSLAQEANLAALLLQVEEVERWEGINVPLLCLASDPLSGLGKDSASWVLYNTGDEYLSTPMLAAQESDEVSQEREEPLMLAEQAAYIIYTSGSTGKPKGVVVSHRNVNNFFLGIDQILEQQEGVGVWLAVTSVSFDISVLELIWTLCRGIRVVIQETAEQAREKYTIAQQLSTQGVTYLQCTPSLVRQLLQVPGIEEALQEVEWLLLGGEALPEMLLQQLEQVTAARVQNMYGPTETTIWSTSQHVQAQDKMVSIGKPLNNTQVYVLDQQQRLVPVGVAGELYIGGEGVTRGYLHQPDVTAEYFVPHPYSQHPGARLYRTGDRVRWQETGRLEYLGRADQQVKVRGHRIELGEIEKLLEQCEEIAEAVVQVRKDHVGEEHLVAYVVDRSGKRVDWSQVRAYLQRRLPEAMVPTRYMLLEEWPLTPNGKINRQALLLPQGEARIKEKDTLAPRTGLEEILAELWGDVLGGLNIGVEDNFFASGGHSLLATRLLARMRVVLQEEIPLRWLFEHPTIARMARVIEQERNGLQGEALPQLQKVMRDQDLPLSFAQQRLWFLHQLDPQNVAYIIPNARRLRGPLDIHALGSGLFALVQSHESLRTTFGIQNGQPVQIINSTSDFRFPYIDLLQLSSDEREREAQRLASQERHRTFDLMKGPLFRIYLLRLEKEEHVLLLTMHHIISDGWSMQVLVRQLTAFYQAYVLGQALPLPHLPVQYADYALWQRQWLQGEVLAAQLQYWREQLAHASVLALPTDRARPASQSFRGAMFAINTSTSLRAQLIALSQEEGVTLFMLLLAAFQVLLLHYTGQTDISVGTPIANRTRAEVEDVIGFFVNTLVLRTDLSGNPTFVELLARVREVTLGAYTHQDVPFEYLVEVVQPERDLSRPPLFQVMFGVQHLSDEADLEGIKVSSLRTEHTTTKCDLTLNVVSSSQGLYCSVEYSTDLFAVETIQDLLQHWEFLLTELLRSPEQHVQQLSLLSADQQQAVLALASGSAEEAWSIQDSWPGIVSEQARQHPDAIAVVDETQCVSYAYLESRANQLAHGLRTLGVGPEVLVGVWAQRRLGSLISLLAILKAGGGYLPLDPDYPQARLEHLLQETEVRLVLSDEPVPTWVHAAGRRVLVEAHAGTWVQRFSVQEPSWEVHPEQVAYVIYTSGSTGGPKGVTVSQRGISNLGREQGRAFGIGPQSRVLQFASWSFDASIAEIVVTLQAGGCVFLASSQALLPGAALQEQVRRWGITTVTLPPSVLRVQAEESLPTVETLIVAGEACSSEVVARWSVGRQMFNAYGPTETTVCASLQRCEEAEGRPGIGRPLGQMQTYVLDAQMQPVPLGVEGELYIGGVGVARGYLGRGDITGERFVPNPYAGRGARFYRTGDRVKWVRNGTLSYEGRTDGQVKVRGYRIELGEIEEVLLGYEGVREAVVVVQDGDRVVGYVGGASDAKEGIQAYLKERLPGYLVPGQIVWRESLPHLPNGKLDRRKVKQEGSKPEMRDEDDGARTEREKVVEEVWCEVLGDEQIGIHENFFDLGGHSLLATQIVARLEAIYQIELPLKSVFEAPTIALLAAHIEQMQAVLLAQIEDEELSKMLEALEELSDSDVQSKLLSEM